MEIEGINSLVLKIFIAFLVPAILYWQDLALIFTEALSNDISTHIMAVPILLGFILYRRRMMFSSATSFSHSNKRNIMPIEEVTGTLLCFLAYMLKWYGSYTFNPLEYHVASLPIFVAGIVLLVFNAHALRTLFFPIFFLLFLIPPPLELAYPVGSTLATISARTAFKILKALGLSVSLLTQYGSPVIQLTTRRGVIIPFAIDVACSGIYSLIGFILFAAFVAYISRGTVAKKIVVFALGTPIIYALNILRVTLLILIGYYVGAETALKAFHIMGGWTLVLLGTLILLVVAEKAFMIQIFGTTSKTCNHSEMDDDGQCISCGKILKISDPEISKLVAAKIILILAMAISLSFIEIPVFTLTEGRAEVFSMNPTGEETTKNILPEIEGYIHRFVFRDVEFENISGQDASLIYEYTPIDRTAPIVWIGLEIAPVKWSLHSWEVCLITWPETYGGKSNINKLDLRDVHLLQNPPLSARYLAFQNTDTNNTQVILYWYARSIFKTEEGYDEKWSKISVIEYIEKPGDYTTAEEELLYVAKAIANFWQPVTTWSWIALIIAQNGLIIIIMTLISLIATLFFSLYLVRNRRREAIQAYKQISDPEELQILDAVKALKKYQANESNIISKYREISGKEIEMERLHKKLAEALEAGLIERGVISINDEPHVSWRPYY